jgi:hypothetical protein
MTRDSSAVELTCIGPVGWLVESKELFSEIVLVASNTTRTRAITSIVSTLEIILTIIVVLWFLKMDLIRLIITTIFYKKMYCVVNIFGQKDALRKQGFVSTFWQYFAIISSI